MAESLQHGGALRTAAASGIYEPEEQSNVQGLPEVEAVKDGEKLFPRFGEEFLLYELFGFYW